MIEKKQNLSAFKITKKEKISSPERIFLLLLQKMGVYGGRFKGLQKFEKVFL